MAQLWAPDGVVAGYKNQLSGTYSSTGPKVTLNPGACFVHGYYCEIITAQPITVGASGTVVARADLDNEVCLPFYHAGAVDYNGYQQDDHAWEVPLWLVSSGTLTDLRTYVSGGAGLSWPGQLAVSSVSSGQTINFNFMYPRVPYPTWSSIVASGVVTFSDAGTAQSVQLQLSFQYGQTDVQLIPANTPTGPGPLLVSIPGSGPSGTPFNVPFTLTGVIPVTKGKKTVGCLVQADTGPGIQVGPMTAVMTQTHLGAQTAS